MFNYQVAVLYQDALNFNNQSFFSQLSTEKLAVYSKNQPGFFFKLFICKVLKSERNYQVGVRYQKVMNLQSRKFEKILSIHYFIVILKNQSKNCL